MKKLCLAIFILTLAFAGIQAQWIRYKVAKNYPPDIQQLGFLKCIKELPDGNIICSDAAMYAHILKDKEWYPYPDTSMLPPASPLSMLLDSAGNLWMSSTNGLRYLDVKAGRYMQYYNGKVWAYDPSKPPGDNQFYNMVKCIALDSTGGLWLSGMSNAFELARLKDGVWTKYRMPEISPKYFVAGEGGSPSMEIQKDGTVWYRSYGGIVRFRPQSNEWTLFDTLRIGDSIINIGDGAAMRIMAASDGTVWCGVQPFYMLHSYR